SPARALASSPSSTKRSSSKRRRRRSRANSLPCWRLRRWYFSSPPRRARSTSRRRSTGLRPRPVVQHHQDVALVDEGAGGHAHLAHAAPLAGRDGNVHLHGLQHDHFGAGRHLVALPDLDLGHDAGHVCSDEVDGNFLPPPGLSPYGARAAAPPAGPPPLSEGSDIPGAPEPFLPLPPLAPAPGRPPRRAA